MNDALGRAERVTYPDGKEVGYTYGKAGERRSLTYPDGRTVSYGYDEEIRLSELKEGDAVIRYGYDPAGRLLEKVFLNGTRTAYTYDRKSRVTGLTHMDGEGIIDQYVYEYDPAGNKTGIRKERRGLGEESGQYAYVYDALGRLTEARKDGRLLRRYGYDAFGNLTELAEGGKRTEYAYNALNQLVAKRDSQGETLYEYDRRGNLTELMENGALKNRYAYGALNRLERAEGVGGIAAEYQYNGLGHRTGKEVKDGLNPESRIRYVIDLTREYHNLLQKEEGKNCQTYLWDGNVAGMSERSPGTEMASSGKLCRKYYLQDELGSPLRLSGADGNLGEAYGYDEFGRDLYGNQGETQAFGYTGYQYDNVSGTYFAQAREYDPGVGRFAGMDVIGGFVDVPVTLNRYGYCLQNPVRLVDLNGKTPIEGCTGECDEKGIPHSQYHECSRVNNQVFFYNDIFSKSISVNRKGIKGRWNMETQGWEDDHGKLQWNTETRVANVSVDIAYDGGISGSLLEQDISFRTIRTKNKEIHLGATGGLFSIGAGSGTDIDVTNKGIKISFGKASKVFADMAFWIRIDNVEMCDK